MVLERHSVCPGDHCWPKQFPRQLRINNVPAGSVCVASVLSVCFPCVLLEVARAGVSDPVGEIVVLCSAHGFNSVTNYKGLISN